MMRYIPRLLAVATLLIPPAALAQLDCPSTATPLSESTPVNGTGARCYQFQVPEASPFVRFEVDADDAVDLYFSKGLQTSLSDWDRLNANPIEGDAKFVLVQQDPGAYTVAVASEATTAGYSLSATAGVLSGEDEPPLTVCTEGGTCTTALMMRKGPSAIELGSSFGDRVIVPFTVTAAGKIEVTASWLGTADELMLILDGPKRLELPNPSAYYQRSLGASPLTLTYDVTSEDVQHGKRFQVSLVNFSGGEASGGIDIETPPTVYFNYVHLAKLGNLVRDPVKPRVVRPIPPPAVRPRPRPVIRTDQIRAIKSQEQVCRESVQGKIAWNYEGNKRWAPANLERLCKGTTQGEEPGLCFRRVVHGNVSWGGSTRWQWENAIHLCAGTSDATRTVRCFEARIRRGSDWRRAISECDVR